MPPALDLAQGAALVEVPSVVPTPGFYTEDDFLGSDIDLDEEDFAYEKGRSKKRNRGKGDSYNPKGSNKTPSTERSLTQSHHHQYYLPNHCQYYLHHHRFHHHHHYLLCHHQYSLHINLYLFFHN